MMQTAIPTIDQTVRAFANEVIVLRIKSLPNQPYAEVRLRRLLKAMLRGHGFRCLECLPADPDFGTVHDDR